MSEEQVLRPKPQEKERVARHAGSAKKRKTYSRPALTRWGDIKEITRGAVLPPGDDLTTGSVGI